MKRVYLLNPVSDREVVSYFQAIAVHPDGIEIMEKKSAFYTFRIKDLTSPAANVLKQEALAAGAELATAWNVIKDPDITADALLMGTYRQMEIIVRKIKAQQFGLSDIAVQLESAIGNLFNASVHFRYRDTSMDFENGPKLMGVVNVTPDSFSDGKRYFSADAAVAHALSLCEDGADIIDIGGESTRPGSDPVDAGEEKRRVIPVIKRLREKTGIPISIDTVKSEVAAQALENGADIVNDVSAMTFDPDMPHVIGKYRAGVVLMHMKGTPKTMQVEPEYGDVMAEVLSFLEQRAAAAEKAGIGRDCIILDPGIGFGKTIRHNLLLLKHIRAFKSLGFPVLVGASRKSFIGQLANAGTGDRMPGSIAAAVWAAAQGVDIIRVHDVKETKQALTITQHIRETNA